MKYFPKSHVVYPSQLDTLRHQPPPAESARPSECPALQAVVQPAPQPTVSVPAIVTVMTSESAVRRWNAPARTVH